MAQGVVYKESEVCMSKADEFAEWCNLHRKTLPFLPTLRLAREAVYELQRAKLVLTEQVDTLQQEVEELKVRYFALQCCGNCGRGVESDFGVQCSEWLNARTLGMDPYMTMHTWDTCQFTPSRWTVLQRKES